MPSLVMKPSQYSIKTALTDYVLMDDVTLVLKSDWFALYAAMGTNQSIVLYQTFSLCHWCEKAAWLCEAI